MGHSFRSGPFSCSLFEVNTQQFYLRRIVHIFLPVFHEVAGATPLMAVSGDKLEVEMVHRAVAHGAKIDTFSAIDSLQRAHCLLRENIDPPAQIIRDLHHVLIVGLADNSSVTRCPGISDQHTFKQLIFK